MFQKSTNPKHLAAKLKNYPHFALKRWRNRNFIFSVLPKNQDVLNGVLNSYHYINKVVSDDYELTEQDKKDQSSGKVVFSYDDSASQIEVSQVQSVN